MRRPERILVTGGAGFIGSAFIRWVLSREKLRIVNLDKLTYAANLRLLDSVALHPDYRFVQGDILDQPLIEQLLREEEIDTVVHFAAETHVDRSIAEAAPFIETNVLGTLSLLEAVRNVGEIHFHHISTDEVYGTLGESGLFHERSPYRPNSPYAASKAASDHLVRAFAQTYGLSTTLSHSSNNYGPGQYPEKFIPLMILHALSKKPLPLYGRGTNVRDWLHVDDHAAGVFRILLQGERGETYNLGGSSEKSNLDLLHLLLGILAEETKQSLSYYLSFIQFVADRPGHDFRYAIDTSKARQQLGWTPQIPLLSGLRETIRWYLEIPNVAHLAKA